MGFLFGKKKVSPKVPFPQGEHFDERSLKFTASMPTERVIEPKQLKAAVGVDKALPEVPFEEKKGLGMNIKAAVGLGKNIPEERNFMTNTHDNDEDIPMSVKPEDKNHLFIKVDVYQRMLGEVDGLKSKVDELASLSKGLDTSEFNEENDFNKLKRNMKAMHDNILRLDRVIFKN